MTPTNRRLKAQTSRTSFDSSGGVTASPQPTKAISGVLGVVTTMLGVSSVCAASVGIAWAARRYVTRSPRFAVTQIEVVGTERRSSEDLVAESGLAVGPNIFAVDVDAARAHILADPWIADASVTRKLPGTVSVKVVERKPAALVALGDMFLADDEGTPFKRLEAGDSFDLPIVTGIRPESLTEDPGAATRTIRRAMELAAEFERGPMARRLPLQEIHVAPDGTFALVVGHAGTELELGPPPFRRKLEQAARVVSDLDRRGAKAEAVLLDNDTRPDRVVVRLH